MVRTSHLRQQMKAATTCIIHNTAVSITSLRILNPAGWAKNPRSSERGFFICVRRTQHHLTEGQHHFERSENIIPHLCGHKRTMLRQVANDVMLRINNIALHAKG
jgi:hypothetical protein